MWLFFEHPVTGGITSVPDNPGVREYYLARGWKEVPDPDAAPPEPPPEPGETDPGSNPPEPSPEAQEWVTLYHPAVNAFHQFPNNPGALAGAYAAGWVDPPPPGEPTPGDGPDPVTVVEPTPEPDPEPEPAPEPDPEPVDPETPALTEEKATARATARKKGN